MLGVLDILHPFSGAAGHLLKFYALPDRFVQPVGDSGCQHTDDADLHAVDVVSGVGLQTGIDALWIGRAVLVGFLDNVRTQQRTAHLTDPFVVDLMAGFYIVIAHGLSIVFHIVDHRGSQVLVLRHHVVRPVHTGLPLQDIAVVDQQQVFAILLTLFLDIGVSACEGAVDGPVVHKVPREEMPVHIARFNHFQPYGLRGRLGCS